MSIPADRMPKHPNRRRIMEFLKESPGASLQEIADHLNVARNAATYHVRSLMARSLVVQDKIGRRRVHFLPDERHPARRSLLSMVRQQTVRRILESLQQDSETSWRALARDLDISAHTVRWHIKRLDEEGLIHVVPGDGDGGHRVYMHPEVHELMGVGEVGMDLLPDAGIGSDDWHESPSFDPSVD